MAFELDERVVFPAFGVGQIVGIAANRFQEDQARTYYEVANARGTVWVEVEAAATRGLRPITRVEELGQYREVLSGRPQALNQDHRQRQLDLRVQLNRGTMQAYCEMARDLSAQRRRKPLNEKDMGMHNQCRNALCQEWAAARNASLGEATAEIDALLAQSYRAYPV